MTSSAQHTSVIICAYTEERWNELVKAIESVKAQTTPVLEIILVVDHNPRLLDRARASLADIRLIENTEPRGLSGARNSGVAAANGYLLAFLDDDAIAAPDWHARLLLAFTDPLVLGEGGIVEPIWEKERPKWFPPEFDWVVGCSYNGLPDTAVQVRNLFGGCMAIRSEVFETIGGFRVGIGRDEKRPMGCEETELCIRANQHWPERRFMFEPRIWAYHHVPAKRCTWRYFQSRCYAEGLSKAQVTVSVGSQDGLASEVKYTFLTLPRGVLRHLRNAVAHHDLGELSRGGAIVAGLAITAAGYLVGRLAQLIHSRKYEPDGVPIKQHNG